MEPLLVFFGNYWWLIFPAMGVMGAVGSAWERGARRRHKRRLEIMHAKAELKAAQAAARGRGTYPLTGPVPQQSPQTQPVAQPVYRDAAAPASGTQLERLFAAHDAVTARWLEYELDVAKLISYPAMSDGRQPLTAAFLRAKKVADGLRPANAKARITKAQLAEYRDAVTDYEVAFDVAERDARRIKDSGFTDVERKRLDTAKQLLTVAIDQAATPAERQLAYRRVREELDGLISLSDEAIVVLEKRVALELTTGARAAAAPGAPTAASSRSPAAPGVQTQGPSVEPSAGAGQPASVRPPGATTQPRGTWPVPSRSGDTAPGRIVRPKPRP